MAALIAVIAAILFIGLVAGPIIYFQSRRVLTEQKNYERGLKMVTLYIHLPPPSDDTDIGARDIRDVTDENISKAEILYGIVASTFKKEFKSRFYGQRHISFEIIGTKGIIEFYVAVPISLVDVVHQAVVSAYPTAILEEVAEHNIFSPVGKISSTLGGELTLKENYAYPISTYQDLKRDPINSVLNALSTLDKEDGAGIQIMVRPAEQGWTKKAAELAKKKRKGKDSSKAPDVKALSWFAAAFEALWRPPEGKSGSGNEEVLSSHEEGIVAAIEEKTRKPGFETVIRVITSSNIASRSQMLLNNVVASFSLYDAPGKNGFKYTPAQDIEEFVTAYILRFFPQEHNKNILNSIELATLYHFPQQTDIPTSQVTRQGSKQVDGPRNVPDKGLLLGYNVFRGTKKPIRLDDSDRQRHMYVVGQTGTGKSVFLENLGLQDMINGNGFAFIDPHGDTAEKLLSMVPKERTEDVIYFCPADSDYPLGLNIFEAETDDQKDFVIQEVINVLYKLYDPQRQGIIGPRYEHLFRNAALTVMAGPDGGSFIDIPKLFRDKDYVAQKLKYVTDQNVLEFWQKEMPQSQRSNEFGEVVSWFVSKFGAFLSNSMMRNIIGQIDSSFDLRDIMDNKKILLVNLSKGRTGELNSRLLGMMFVMKFQAAAMSRANIPEDDRVDFALYVDEFQNFSTDSFATIMSEARKYHLNLIVANQFTTQLTDEIRDAVFGNMGTIVSFRVGQNDVESLSRYFQPLFDGDDLLRVPNYNTIVRTLIGGVPTQPFSMATIPPLGSPNLELGQALKQLSAAKHGRPREAVENEIFARLRTKDQEDAFQSGQNSSPPNPEPARTSPSGPPASSAGPSFLDQWLAKRQSAPPSPKPGINRPINSTASPSNVTTKTASSASKASIVQHQAPPLSYAKKPSTNPVANPTASQTIKPDSSLAPEKIQQTIQQPKTNELKISRDSSNTKPDSNGTRNSLGDTIYIDRDGNLKQKTS
ncbi:MAG TPA: ATP-binding protein [Patescibacteria group bacterium]|nr:ATP-binding protein [Patescibacteria group bacterium]